MYSSIMNESTLLRTVNPIGDGGGAVEDLVWGSKTCQAIKSGINC